MDIEKLKILICDDARDVREYLAAVLEVEYHIEEARDGLECLDVIYHSPPDLLLLDVMMPHLGGDEVCFNLKKAQSTHNIPIVLISSIDQTDYESQFGKVLANGYLRKPIAINELTSTVESLLRCG